MTPLCVEKLRLAYRATWMRIGLVTKWNTWFQLYWLFIIASMTIIIKIVKKNIYIYQAQFKIIFIFIPPLLSSFLIVMVMNVYLRLQISPVRLHSLRLGKVTMVFSFICSILLFNVFLLVHFSLLCLYYEW